MLVPLPLFTTLERICPTTSRATPGEAVPTPTLPALVVMLPLVAMAPLVLMAVVPPIVPEVIALPETLPAVEIVASLLSAMAALAEISVFVMVPLAIFAAVTAPDAIVGLG